MPDVIIESEWLTRQLNIPNIESISSVRNFSIFWNIFEEKYFQNGYRPSKIGTMYDLFSTSLLLIDNQTQQIMNFFKNRYFRNGMFTHEYSTLFLRIDDDEQNIKNVIQGIINDRKNIFICIITIIGRFRNNLFHGLKSPSEIVNQNEIFAYINCYLSQLIDQ